MEDFHGTVICKSNEKNWWSVIKTHKTVNVVHCNTIKLKRFEFGWDQSKIEIQLLIRNMYYIVKELKLKYITGSFRRYNKRK